MNYWPLPTLLGWEHPLVGYCMLSSAFLQRKVPVQTLHDHIQSVTGTSETLEAPNF